MAKRRFNLLPLLIAGLALGGWLWWRPYPQPAPIQVVTEPSPSPELILSGQSSDGQIDLKLSRKPGAETSTWTLTASRDQKPAQPIWTQTLPNHTSLSLPLNAVSPDNQYLFFRMSGPDATRYLVVSTAGEPLTPDSPAIEFASLFEAKQPDYKITAVTGWGGINLIVINTDKISGGIGPSFWFDVPSRTFIRLSNRFE